MDSDWHAGRQTTVEIERTVLTSPPSAASAASAAAGREHLEDGRRENCSLKPDPARSDTNTPESGNSSECVQKRTGNDRERKCNDATKLRDPIIDHALQVYRGISRLSSGPKRARAEPRALWRAPMALLRARQAQRGHFAQRVLARKVSVDGSPGAGGSPAIVSAGCASLRLKPAHPLDGLLWMDIMVLCSFDCLICASAQSLRD